MRKLIFIFLVCYLSESNSQEFIVNYGDNDFMNVKKLPAGFKQVYTLKNRLPDGDWKVVYGKDSIILIKGRYRNKRKHGIWESYDVDGILWKSENYKKGKLVDTTKLYYRNGSISHELTYQSKGLTKIEYYAYDGGLKKTEIHKNGEKLID